MSAGRDEERGELDRAGATAPSARSSGDDIARFLAETAAKARRTAGGRLIFALDATMSRQPTWDRAARLQAAMFEEAARIGGLEVQLVYYRGQGECRATGSLDVAAGTTATGQCQADSNRFGCRTTVKDGKAEATLCID